ncbi:MAG: NADH-quinone oxidoreductase subunit J [Candidatus Omnitrophica bacterium]|nr:NADH-quinone oxidoreductase subunit J [Candidatus Omnitrophota bacterium]
MEPLYLVARAGLYLASLVTLAAAVMVVTLRNIFHCALALALVLLGVAVTYVSLKAEFLAVIQILLYVGAILTLMIYAIMLTHRIGSQVVPQTNRQSLISFALLGLFNVFFTAAVLKTDWKLNPSGGNLNVDARALGNFFMGEYVFPFEIISVVLIVALVGAVILGRSDE